MPNKLRIAIAASFIATTVGITFASRSAMETANETESNLGATGAASMPQVPVAEVITRLIAPSKELTGYLASPQTVELRSRIGGAIDSINVPEGGLVRKGQLLFQIDSRPLQVALDTAKAQHEQAEVMVVQAQADLERVNRLVSSGAISKKIFDDAVATLGIRQAQLQSAKAAVSAARLDLAYAQITAPISGRVDRVLVTEGNLVSGGTAGAATLLTTIVSVDPMHVYFDIDEATYLNIVKHRQAESGKEHPSLPVEVQLPTNKGLPYQGVLDFVSNQIDRSTGIIRARATVANPNGQLIPGLFTHVRLFTDKPRETILIDDQAVGADQGSDYVLVVDTENQAQYRPIKPGPKVDQLRVVNSGLQAGEKIIIKGLVRPGMSVSPLLVPMQTTSIAASSDLAMTASINANVGLGSDSMETQK